MVDIIILTKVLIFIIINLYFITHISFSYNKKDIYKYSIYYFISLIVYCILI